MLKRKRKADSQTKPRGKVAKPEIDVESLVQTIADFKLDLNEIEVYDVPHTKGYYDLLIGEKVDSQGIFTDHKSLKYDVPDDVDDMQDQQERVTFRYITKEGFRQKVGETCLLGWRHCDLEYDENTYFEDCLLRKSVV